MQCKAKDCIFNEAGKCFLDDISIGEYGSCESRATLNPVQMSAFKGKIRSEILRETTEA